ncbi:MAG: nucleoside 2-deoxyribosyltransferase [Hyphomicrobiaceae bacterium]
MSPTLPRIYLAGPEVFLPDAQDAGRRKAALAAEHGLEGVFPLDAALDLVGLPKPEAARRIALANKALMRSCDALIANLTPFRGISADAGTVFEVGYMRALGKPVLGYTNTPLDYRRRAEMQRAIPRLPFEADAPAIAVEDFDLAENLMIEVAILESGGILVRSTVPAGEEMTGLDGFRACLVRARALLV